MSVNVGTLVARLEANTTDFDRGLANATRGAETFGARFGGAAKAGALAAGAAVVAFGVKSFQSFASFEKQMNEVFTLLPGISRDAMDDMTGQVKSFAKEFGVLPDKVVPALYQSLSAGVPKDNVFAFLEQANMLAKGGVTDLRTAVDGLTSVVNAYPAGVIDAAKASDILFAAVKSGKTTIAELSANISDVVPAAAAAGVSFDQVAAGLSAMTLAGTETTVAATSMRQLLVELTKSGTTASDVFLSIAGQSFPAFIASGGTLQEALRLINERADKTGLSMLDMFGSVEAGQAALLLGATGADKFAASLEATKNSAGSMQTAVDQMNSGVSDDLERLKAGFAVFAIDVGNWLATHLMPIFEGMAAWWAENGPGISAVAGALAEALVMAFTVMGAIVTTFAGAVVWVATTIVGAFAGLVNAARATRDGIVTSFRAAVEFVSSIPGQIIAALGNVGTMLYDSGKAIIQGLINGLKDAAKKIAGVIGGILGDARKLLPFSPAKEGPFSGKGWTTYSGAAIIDGLIEGMESRKAALGNMSLDVMHTLSKPINASATSAGGVGGGDVTVPIYLDGKEIARYVWDRHGMTSQMARAS
mgnify:CR=1 FL=1